MQVNEVMKRRLVGGGILVLGLLILCLIFLRTGDEPAPATETPSDLADIRTYAIEVPTVPAEPPQKILAEGPPIGTLLPTPETAEKPADAGVKDKKPAPKKKTPPQAAEPPAMTIPDEGWSVQVGSFASRSNAEGLLQKLKAKGYSAFIFRNAAENPPMFRVRVGPYEDQGLAKDTAQRLRQELSLDVKVVANG